MKVNISKYLLVVYKLTKPCLKNERSDYDSIEIFGGLSVSFIFCFELKINFSKFYLITRHDLIF